MERANEPPDAEASTCRFAWRPDDTAELTATGEDGAAVLLAGLRCVLAAARRRCPGAAVADGATAAVPIRGQGADLARVFAELANDLLVQLDANGPGLDDVRLDGLLTTDAGGLRAWGYAVGAVGDDPPPVGLGLDGEPSVTADPSGHLVLRCRLRREP